MTVLIEYNAGELKAEADHRIANNLASLGSVVRLQRAGIARDQQTYTTKQVCTLLDDISARIEVMAKTPQVVGDGHHRQWSEPRGFLARDL